MKLTQKQSRFVTHYLLNGNATEAARLAGYSPNTARVIGAENLTKPAVIDALRVGQAEYAAELQITRQDVITGILHAIDLARTQLNPSAMIQGCVALARIAGLNEPEAVAINVDTSVMRKSYGAMSDSQLLAIARGGSLTS